MYKLVKVYKEVSGTVLDLFESCGCRERQLKEE